MRDSASRKTQLVWIALVFVVLCVLLALVWWDMEGPGSVEAYYREVERVARIGASRDEVERELESLVLVRVVEQAGETSETVLITPTEEVRRSIVAPGQRALGVRLRFEGEKMVSKERWGSW